MSKKILIPLFTICLLASCGDDSASNTNNENGGSNLPPQQGTEIPCDAGNEGLVIKPVDSENPRVCTNGTWVEILSSSSSTKTPEPAEGSSSSSVKTPELAEGSSSSSIKTPEPTEGSSSSAPTEDLSSSSEETKMYLCDDGETYVLDLANCANNSSSSSKTPDPAEESSSSTPILSSSSTLISSSSSTPIEDPCSSSSSVVSSSSSAVSSSSVQSSSSSIIASSSSSSVAKSSSSVNVSSSSISSSSMMLNSIYDATNNTLTDIRDGHVYKTVTIGTQIWMAENLNYLPQDTVGSFWAGRSICGGGDYKSLQEGDCSIYGRLYETSFTENANYRKNICPDGWSIPSKKQYQNLIVFLGDNVGNKLKDNDRNLWSQRDNTNESGFSVIPSGYWSRYYGFNYIEKEGDAVAALAMVPSAIQNALNIYENNYEFAGYGQWFFIAFRCIKD